MERTNLSFAKILTCECRTNRNHFAAGISRFLVSNPSRSFDAEAEINARLLSQVIEAPEMWHFDDLKLEEFLRRRSEHGQPETRRIFDTQRNLIAQSVDAIDQPRITRSVDT